MPWKETVIVCEREAFVMGCLKKDESMSQLCREYGISRRVGYKWLGRYRQKGIEGLKDQSRAPHAHPNQVGVTMHDRVVKLRARHMRWGPRKLKVVLGREQPAEGKDSAASIPAASTIGQILKREGLTVGRRRCRHASASAPLSHCTDCNRVWCVDYKGWFRTLDGRRCDPLTVSDGYSRYLLRCQATGDTGTESVRRVMEACFREFGLPEAIRSDNGSPFASCGVGGLSRLSVWWVRLGIRPERIEPGHPEQNGCHERMHRTLKQETAMPPQKNLGLQQRCFERFRKEFNQDRPHEALGMNTPESVYSPSTRSYPERLAELEYPSDFELRKVCDRGRFRFGSEKVMLGKALEGQVIGLGAVTERYWQVWFGPIKLGIFDDDERRMLRGDQRRRLGL